MREYETMFIVQPEITEEGRNALLEKLDRLLEQGQSANRLELHDHGKRKLAYDIRKFQKGHYLTLVYLDDGAVVPELERALRLEESVLRYLTVQAAPEVKDLEARKVTAAEHERVRIEKAAERAAREAEERAAREAEQREREAAQATAAQAGEEGAASEAASEASPEGDEAPEASSGGEGTEGAEAAEEASETTGSAS